MDRPRPDDHPLEVALLVADHTADDEVVMAALLHDVVEDRQASADEVQRHVGRRVARLVRTLTEDESVEDYEERKAEHRERVAGAGEDAALIFTADKVANARSMRRGVKELDPKKVAHYRATLELMRGRYPGLPLLDELERAIEELASSISSR
ncbi:MAG: HD domain-containing protein [Thermoleophilaceae bacterium]